MDLVLYTLKLRLAQFLSPRRDWKSFVSFLLFLCISLMYAKGIASLLDSEEFFDRSPEVVHLLKPGLFIGVAVLTLLRAFFPSYKRISSWVQGFHPLSKIRSYAMKLLSDYVSSYFIIMGVGIVYLSLESINFTYIEGISLLLVLLGAHILRRLLQILLENRYTMKSSGAVILVLGVACLMFLQFNDPFYQVGLAWSLVPSLFLLFGISYYMEECQWKESRSFEGVNFSFRNPIPTVLFKTKAVRTSLLIGLAFKAVFLYAMTRENADGFGVYILILFYSPMILFTYVFNNAWGHFRNTWKLIDGCNADPRLALVYYLKLLSIPLLLDFTIFLGYFFSTGMQMQNLVIYFASLIVLIVNGFFWSMFSPFHVSKMVMGFKSNTSILGTLVSMLSVFLLALIQSSRWMFVVAGVCLVLSFLLLKVILDDYPKYRYKLFTKLYKG